MGLASILDIRGARDKPEDRYRGQGYFFLWKEQQRVFPKHQCFSISAKSRLSAIICFNIAANR